MISQAARAGLCLSFAVSLGACHVVSSVIIVEAFAALVALLAFLRLAPRPA